jgi:MOSC domain-containing protein YiiM
VLLRRLGLAGDVQADPRYHGGTNKAVYAYPSEHYAYWQQQLGRSDFEPGQFGENLTVEGLLEDEVCLGDIYRVGGAVLAVTQPRTPCFKLGIRMDLPQFPKLFLASGLLGFYLRVLEEGEVGAGDRIEKIDGPKERITIRELWRLVHQDPEDVEGARRALHFRAHLHTEWREPLEERVRGG